MVGRVIAAETAHQVDDAVLILGGHCAELLGDVLREPLRQGARFIDLVGRPLLRDLVGRGRWDAGQGAELGHHNFSGLDADAANEADDLAFFLDGRGKGRQEPRQAEHVLGWDIEGPGDANAEAETWVLL